jgi:hypothetical protein
MTYSRDSGDCGLQFIIDLSPLCFSVYDFDGFGIVIIELAQDRYFECLQAAASR